MKSNASTFNYHFRTPGVDITGPVFYAIGQSTMGAVLVARSEKGVCAVFLGDSAYELPGLLSSAFPTIEAKEHTKRLNGDLTRVIAFIENDATDGSIDLNIGGTPFQQKVWRALCDIPAGQTCSYSELAQGLGMPNAVRAVASACAANVLAIVIPCHRVLRIDRSISGYRWGPERKRALLAKERT